MPFLEPCPTLLRAARAVTARRGQSVRSGSVRSSGSLRLRLSEFSEGGRVKPGDGEGGAGTVGARQDEKECRRQMHDP